MDESKLDENRIGRKKLDENRLDENWAHDKNIFSAETKKLSWDYAIFWHVKFRRRISISKLSY